MERRFPSLRPARPALFLALALALVLAGCAAREPAPQPVPPGPAAEPAPQGPDLAGLILDKVRQYLIPNHRVGRVFVIEGNARNLSGHDVAQVRVEGALYGEGNAVLLRKQQFCGPTLSVSQLQGWSILQMEAALNDRSGIAARNSRVAPGQSTPFMILFYNPPAETMEFAVTVVGARSPVD